MNKLVWHQVILFSIFLGLTLLRVLKGQVGFDLNLIWWWLGGMLGFLFVFCDRLVYALVSNREKQKHLVMRSALFMAIWAVLAIFTATSVGTGFPRGFVLGLGTHLVFDLWWDYRFGRRDIELWFWQVKNVTKAEIDWFFRGAVLFYLLIFWFL